MPNPTLLAQSQILAYRCVKMTTASSFVAPASLSTDSVIGVTTKDATSTNSPVVFQENENNLVILTAGGTIASGDNLCPSTGGTVITTTGSYQFVSCESASSGETFWAQRAASSINSNSTRAKQFIRDAIAGTDSVDVLIGGDSNTNYGGWGWCDGMTNALVTAGALHYSTPLVPVFSRENATYYGFQSKFDSYSRIWDDGSVQNATGTPALGNSLVRGDSAPAGLYNLLNRTSGTLRPNASPFYFGYFAGSNNWADFLGGLYTTDDTTQLAWQGSALSYRVVYAKGPSMGSFQPTFRRNGGGDALVVAGTRVSCADASGYSWNTTEFSISEDANRNTTGRVYLAAYADNTWGNYYITGQVALALHSLSRSVKGIAVQSISHYGGATTNQVALDAFGATLVISQYMRETRARQIARGGTGRVIVMFQGGVNGTGSSTFAADCTMFMETCRSCWLSLGYPETDLGFIGLTSHQDNDPDTITAIRASAATLANTYTMVNGASLASYATLLTGSGGTSYFANATTERQHLTEAGYKYICGQLVTALIS
jgi:hypothetical protein